MKRRAFVRNSFLAGTSLAIAPSVLANELSSFEKITILHTNDTHSQIDPFPSNHSKFAGLGGVVARQNLIQKIRSEEKHVLLLDAGDIFQGTPYFNKYHGVLEMKVMSMLGYDAGTMGNHDFDAGLDGFLKAKKEANFPFLTSNYDFEDTILKGETRDFEILQRGKLKIGIFGVGVELQGLVPDTKFGNTVYLNPIDRGNKIAKILHDKGCDLIICLSHLGYEYVDKNKASDMKLARESELIDVIIGGHTHTFLDKPTIIQNSVNKSVVVNQVGWAGVQLGRIDFYFERTRRHEGSSILIFED